jgi:4'-phosphopantetheinyl transferase
VHVARLGLLRSGHEAWLDDRERTRAARFRQGSDRTRFVLGAVLVRAAAGAALGVPATSIALDRTCDTCGQPHGRPRVVDGAVHVSIAHSGDVVVAAVTGAGPVGVDVEAVAERAGADYREMCPSVCTAEERRSVDGRDAFVTYWTRKEAVLKATGHGLRLPLTQVVVTPPDQPPGLLAFEGRPPPPCWMRDVDVGAAYRGAVAVLTTAAVLLDVVDAAPLLTKA